MIKNEVVKNTRWTKSFYNKQNLYTEGKFWDARQASSLPNLEDKAESHISLNKMDVLFLNPEARIQTIPIVGESYIESVMGIQLKGNEDPFVFLEDIALLPLIQNMNRKPIQEGLQSSKPICPNLIQ